MKWIQQRTRRAMTAVATGMVMLLAVGAGALTLPVPANVYTLPVDPGDATTVDLSQPPPGNGEWVRLRPNDPPDLVEDHTTSVTGVFNSGPATPSAADPWFFDITFTVTWNGTINEQAPSQAIGSQMLFAIVDSRFGTGMSIDTTTDLPSSGFVRGSMAVNGVPVLPEIVLDDTGAMTGMFEGFVRDGSSSQGCPCNRWLGFYLPANDITHVITMSFALGQDPGTPGDVFFPTALFLPVGGEEVPEPGTAVLVGLGALVVGAARRRRRDR